MSYRDPAVARARDRERVARRTAERRAAGLCPKCGKRQPEPDRSICEPCAERARAAGRVRDARLRAEGKPRRDPERAKSCQRGRSRRQAAARLAAGVCTKCGANPPQDGRRLCAGCAGKRRAAARRRHAEASARGELYRGQGPGGQAPHRAGAQPQAPARPHGGGSLHPLRERARSRRRRRLRALQGSPPLSRTGNGSTCETRIGMAAVPFRNRLAQCVEVALRPGRWDVPSARRRIASGGIPTGFGTNADGQERPGRITMKYGSHRVLRRRSVGRSLPGRPSGGRYPSGGRVARSRTAPLRRPLPLPPSGRGAGGGGTLDVGTGLEASWSGKPGWRRSRCRG